MKDDFDGVERLKKMESLRFLENELEERFHENAQEANKIYGTHPMNEACSLVNDKVVIPSTQLVYTDENYEVFYDFIVFKLQDYQAQLSFYKLDGTGELIDPNTPHFTIFYNGKDFTI